MITKKIIAPLIAVIIISGIGGVVAAQKKAESQINRVTEAANTAPAKEAEARTGEPQASNSGGRYAGYSNNLVGDAAFDQTILFFYASWCPECQSFKKAINESEIPEKTQVLEVDYDKATDLKKQYGVTLQSTFVKIDANGNKLSKWVGYGKDKSLQSVINNL